MASDTLNPTLEQEPAQGLAQSADVGEALTIGYQGKAKPIAGIQLKNLLLLIPTIGVYRFWAISRLRRYFWSSLTANGDRLEYTGRGMELFMGLILVLLVLVPIGTAFAFLFNFLLIDYPVLAFSLYFAFFIGLLWLGYMGAFFRHRYIMSRTRWRGIRFALKGSAAKFGLYGMGQFFLVMITLSLYTPFATMNLNQRLWGNTFVGDQPIDFVRKTEGLLSRYLLIFASYLFGYLAFVGILWFGARTGSAATGILLILFTIVWWLSFFYFIAVYQGRVYRNLVDSLGFQNLSFSSEYHGKYLFIAYTIASLIVLPVAILAFAVAGAYVQGVYGFGEFFEILEGGSGIQSPIEIISAMLPWFIAGLITYFAVLFVAPVVIQHRLFRDLVKTTTISGTFNPEKIKQSQEALDSRGEGLATALDIGGL